LQRFCSQPDDERETDDVEQAMGAIPNRRFFVFCADYAADRQVISRQDAR